MLDEDVKDKFIKVLKEIVAGDLSNVDIRLGMCNTLFELRAEYRFFEGYKIVRCNCEDWEHYSGCIYYPVSGEQVYKNYSYDILDGLWQGEQLTLRQSLAQHLLTKLEENTYVL